MKIKEIKKKHLQQFKNSKLFLTKFIFFSVYFYFLDYFISYFNPFGIYKNQIGHIK